jgi:hypothetical protein
VVLVTGCSDSDGKAAPATSASATSAPVEASSSAPAAKSVDEALAEYEQAIYSGCSTADDCQTLMTAQLAAAAEVKAAMQAKDPTLYAVPIGYVNLAEERADHYGRDNLGAKGNSFAVSQPLTQMTAWFREHPEG